MRIDENTEVHLKIERVREALAWARKGLDPYHHMKDSQGGWSWETALEMAEEARPEVRRLESIVALLESPNCPAICPKELRP